LLHFKIFENEVKNTKKDFIKYLYNIYMCCAFLGKACFGESLSEKVSTFVEQIKKDANEAIILPQQKKESHVRLQAPVQPLQPLQQREVVHEAFSENLNELMGKMNGIPGMTGIPGMPEMNTTMMNTMMNGMMSGMGSGSGSGMPNGINDIMSSILGNQNILNIASDISKQMHTQNINPMEMLSGLMSGNIENSPLQSLVGEIQQKVELKISSGEINKDELETQAQSIMNNINTNGMNSVPGIAELINNFGEKLG
jgi:hypothetical protein